MEYPKNHETLPSSERSIPEDIRSSLFGRCDPVGHEKSMLSLSEIARRLLAEPAALPGVKAYLSRGGEGYERDLEAANGVREELAWALADEAMKRLHPDGD